MDINKKPKDFWAQQKFGKLQIVDENLPKLITKGSNKKYVFKCDCGRFRKAKACSVFLGEMTSCGKCDKNSKEYLLGQQFGKLKLLDIDLPEFIPKCYTKYLTFQCDCGTIKKIIAFNVFKLSTLSCGNCKGNLKEWWLQQKFGKLKLDPTQVLPKFLSRGMDRKFNFICDCGNIKILTFNNVVSLRTPSCGQCEGNPKEYWLSQKFGKLSLLDVNLPNYIPRHSNRKFPFKCDCGNIKEIFGYHVFPGSVKSCGCQMLFPGAVSEASRVMFAELKTYLTNLQFNKKDLLKSKEIDFYNEITRTAIEYNGLHWHSAKNLFDKQLKRDYYKYLKLKELGIGYVGIFSDEWMNRHDIFLNLILNACGYNKNSKRIYDFELIEVSKHQFQEVHDKFHYLSGRQVSGGLYLLAKYKDQVIGGWSFKRLKNGVVDWNRAFWDHNFKAWNPHEKALKYAIQKLSPMSVITFSDNRLFDGSMYEKLEFKKVKELKPDYEYTNGWKRVHKFNFRVKAGINETLEAEKQGFYRIYDCGKTKWELIINEQKNIR